VAEGIEDEATHDWLREIGCDLGQGFGISRPAWLWDLAAWATRLAA
jgi:EAL domain-containing protein (putative c-di-GMP-specific phosphodiesterase class I)